MPTKGILYSPRYSRPKANRSILGQRGQSRSCRIKMYGLPRKQGNPFRMSFQCISNRLPSLRVHRRTWPSCPPVASFLSIASHSTQRTRPLWPESTCDGVSVFKSHSRAFVSLEPMARKFLVNENEVQRMGKVCPPRDDEVWRVILTRPACISTAMDAHLVPIYIILSSSSTKSRKRMRISSEVTTLSLILLWD